MSGLTLTGLRSSGDDGFALGPIDLDVAPGTLTGLCGPASSGKSLLLRCLVGLHPSTGALQLDGVDPRQDRAAARRRVGFCFQRDALLDDEPALANVALACRAAAVEDPEASARAALAAVGLAGAEHKRPAELSGGMRRRVNLARALAVPAPVLLLDDATAGLDPSTAAEVADVILTQARQHGAAVLWVTADVDTVLPLADQLLLLEDGRARYLGRPADLPGEGPLAVWAPRGHEAPAC